jgi:hypothetical protein
MPDSGPGDSRIPALRHVLEESGQSAEVLQAAREALETIRGRRWNHDCAPRVRASSLRGAVDHVWKDRNRGNLAASHVDTARDTPTDLGYHRGNAHSTDRP